MEFITWAGHKDNAGHQANTSPGGERQFPHLDCRVLRQFILRFKIKNFEIVAQRNSTHLFERTNRIAVEGYSCLFGFGFVVSLISG